MITPYIELKLDFADFYTLLQVSKIKLNGRQPDYVRCRDKVAQKPAEGSKATFIHLFL